MTHPEIAAPSLEPSAIPTGDPHATDAARAALKLLREWHAHRTNQLLERLMSLSVGASETARDNVGDDAFFRQCEQ